MMLSLAISGQKYPQNYFIKPVDVPLLLAGNFAEIRSGHFHAGLDIKTGGAEGMDVHAAADGWVSRIKISPWGYGNALYISHPNGYTTVYAHLKSFNNTIASYVMQQQYAKESWQMELFPAKGQLTVKQGEKVALSGNTGGSGGPHLHFEIRDTRTETPLNPLLFGLPVNDHTAPVIRNLAIYHFNNQLSGLNDAPHNIYQTELRNDTFRISGDTVEANDMAGFAIRCIDKMDGSSNRLGVYEVLLYINDSLRYRHHMEAVPFHETRYVNCHADYRTWQADKVVLQRSFSLPGNQLSIYQLPGNNGIIRCKQGGFYHVRYEVADYFGNKSILSFIVKGEGPSKIKEKPCQNRITYSRPFSFRDSMIVVRFPPYVLYEDLCFHYKLGDTISGAITPVHYIQDIGTPLQDYIKISIKTDGLPRVLQDKALIVSLDKKLKVLAAEGGHYQNGYVAAKTRSLGPYCVMIDTTPPVIKPYSMQQGKRLSGREGFSVKISDNLSGIKSFRASVDGQWILMAWDPKKHKLIHWFDGHITPGKHTFKVSVTDKRANTGTWTCDFTY